jgi:hypothetical protein
MKIYALFPGLEMGVDAVYLVPVHYVSRKVFPMSSDIINIIQQKYMLE